MIGFDLIAPPRIFPRYLFEVAPPSPVVSVGVLSPLNAYRALVGTVIFFTKGARGKLEIGVFFLATEKPDDERGRREREHERPREFGDERFHHRPTAA
jgi:hypothetical protein